LIGIRLQRLPTNPGRGDRSGREKLGFHSPDRFQEFSRIYKILQAGELTHHQFQIKTLLQREAQISVQLQEQLDRFLQLFSIKSLYQLLWVVVRRTGKEGAFSNSTFKEQQVAKIIGQVYDKLLYRNTPIQDFRASFQNSFFISL
jgi:hypothetical protein